MTTRFLLAVSAIAAMAFPVHAQNYQRRATFTDNGPRDRGKCTVEVVVDGAAEVTVRGDVGYLRDLSGRPAQWRRFECNGPLPANPVGFRFAGVDGRGRQELIRDPRNGEGAVVRIEDPQGGSEGYTFDLFWDARAGIGNNDRYDNRERGRYDNREPYRDRRFTAEQAIRVCKDSVREQAANQYRVREFEFRSVNMDDNPGRNDWVLGSFVTRRGELFRFSCSVNFDNGRVRSVQVDPARR